LAGSAMSFEQGWISLHQILALRPEADDGCNAMRGARSSYPFNREYAYR
jgi:cyclopropane-fatty-acyl-phospholipid synthase